MKNVVVQGLGFVGSAMAVAVANAKDPNGNPYFNVIGIDLPNELGNERVRKINKGVFPFETVDLKILKGTKEAAEKGNLSATTDNDPFKSADVVLVSINLDLSYNEDKTPTVQLNGFRKAMETLGRNIKEETLIIVETTVPPGTCERIVKPIIDKEVAERGIDPQKIYISHSYERVMPGANYLDSIINFWRVYSGITEKAADKCEEFLSKIINVKEYPLTRLHSTIASESAKVLENSYRAVNIAFIEEWGRFAEDVGFNLFEVINAVRVRPTHSNIRQPGFGVGGYCLTKDPLFAKVAAKEIFGLNNHEFLYSSKAVEINKVMPLVTFNKVNDFFKNELKDKKILMLGISYREDVGDTRFSPSETLYNELVKSGADITAHDPLVEYWEEVKIDIPKEIPDPENFDAVVFTVAHKNYKDIEMKKWLPSNKDIVIFDANNVLTEKQRKEIKELGNTVLSIGRGDK
jgi:UDP-N-acetyl-D-glucosamine dehydrogenase